MALDSVHARLAELAELAQRTKNPSSSPAASDLGAPASLPSLSFGEVLASLAADQPFSLAGAVPVPYGQLVSAAYPSTYGQPAAFGYGSGAGQRALAAAAQEVGHAEFPPGSNDGPRIAQYRSAVAGSYDGAPWCGYFVSYAAAMAGAPIGHGGTGLGSVAQIEQWGRDTGRLLPPGAPPAPGDLVLYGHDHVGIIEAVHPDGSLTTIEGNHLEAVSRVQRAPGEATGFVRL